MSVDVSWKSNSTSSTRRESSVPQITVTNVSHSNIRRAAALARLNRIDKKMTPEQFAFVTKDAGPTFSGNLTKKRFVFF